MVFVCGQLIIHTELWEDKGGEWGLRAPALLLAPCQHAGVVGGRQYTSAGYQQILAIMQIVGIGS